MDRFPVKRPMAGRTGVFGMILLCSISSLSAADQLKPFTSDGCSLFPDGTLSDSTRWQHCCYEHDILYWQGGTEADRKEADRLLGVCVAETGEPLLGKWMEIGVQLGGSPYFPTWYRWGYGWSYPRAYGELTEDEQRQVQRLMPTPMHEPKP